MKKTLILSALSLALLSGAASAANEVRFLGAVTDTTCSLAPSVGGSVNSLVNLGTAGTNASAAPVEFALKAGTEAGCTALVAGDMVHITFSGPLDAAGLKAQAGTATDAIVEIKALNEQSNNANIITSGSDTRVFTGDKFTDSTAEGAKYSATLVGKTLPGDYQSALAFAVTYK